ncbi:MAG TPA: di-heme enzyme [Polyangiaceae bacterium]|nr:di-heme enzyme [Polyangiaceae bacterium]
MNEGGTVTPALDAAAPALDAANGEFAWDLPPGFPVPVVPADNPMSRAKVDLGRRLFYDHRLSGNLTYSCASCHKQELAFTDGRATGLGSTGQSHTRGAMSLANVAYSPTLTWANPLMTELERQANVPLFGDAPIELGMTSLMEAEQRLQAVPFYVDAFRTAFPDDPQPVSMENATRAIGAFERTLFSGNSPFDRWQQGDESAVSDSVKLGYALFNSEKLECFHCHQGFNFTDHVNWEGKSFASMLYHNTGLYDIDGLGDYPEPNTGVYSVTGQDKDMGMFKAPTLRNIALTAPYMHDGSIATLSEVLDHYGARGRAHSQRTDPLLVGFFLSDDERANVIAFLGSLTDQEFITNPAFSDPWHGEDLVSTDAGLSPALDAGR